MNVEANSSSASTTVTDVSNKSASVKNTSSKEKTSDTSFEKELKNADTSEDKKTSSAEKKDNKIESKNDIKDFDDTKLHDINKQNNDLFHPEMNINFTDYKYHNESQNILNQNIQELINTKNLLSLSYLHTNDTTLKASVSYTDNSVQMTESDANFFADLVKNDGTFSIQTAVEQLQYTTEEGLQKVQKNVEVSSLLTEKLRESLKTNQPFRIDFDKDISVIIKVNKDGSLSANFIPGDKAVEQYLRNNISFLRQRFDEQNLPYGELEYGNHRQRQQEQNRQRDKENANE